jgi:hypothetical protein
LGSSGGGPYFSSIILTSSFLPSCLPAFLNHDFAGFRPYPSKATSMAGGYNSLADVPLSGTLFAY